MKKELDAIKSEKVTLFIHGKEREIKFNFSAWSKIVEEYGGLDHMEELQKEIKEQPFSTIPHLMYIGLVDKEGVTEDNIPDDYGINDIKMIMEKFAKAMYGSLPAGDGKGKKVRAEA